jgi:hypothetical protein
MRTMPCLMTLSGVALLALAARGAPPETPRVLGVIQDFEDVRAGKQQPIQHHTWNAEMQGNAERYSQIEIVPERAFGAQCVKITVTDNFPWGNREEYRALTIGPDYLPPEADLVRMRVKVLKGKMKLAIGSPTVYFGHSDVSSKQVEVSAAAEPDWQTLEFSLLHDLRRNTRRARFGEKSPVIHYTRWIQEPLYLYVGKPSAGEFLLDQIELVTQGEGRPYPRFTTEQIRVVAKIADFEDPAERQRAFTFFHEPIDLTKPPYLVREGWKPPLLNLVAEGKSGKFSLRAEHRGIEEACFTGIHALGLKEANAIACTLRVEHQSELKEVALDFLVYAAPAKGRDRFPWGDFQPPESWRKSPLAFDYYLSHPQTRGPNYAFYHVRRTVKNREWTTLVMPCADFVCAYGQAECAPMFDKQLPLACDTIFALAFLSPYGQRNSPTVVLVDDLSFVSVPGEAGAQQSFWQARPAR